MKTVCITGDRSAHPAVALPAVLMQLVKLQQEVGPVALVLGLDQGVEAAVRYAAQIAGIPTVDLQWLTKDWTAYGQAILNAGADSIYVLHGAPMSSSMYPGFMADNAVADAVQLVVPDAYDS